MCYYDFMDITFQIGTKIPCFATVRGETAAGKLRKTRFLPQSLSGLRQGTYIVQFQSVISIWFNHYDNNRKNILQQKYYMS